jgi:hypothetical protein
MVDHLPPAAGDVRAPGEAAWAALALWTPRHKVVKVVARRLQRTTSPKVPALSPLVVLPPTRLALTVVAAAAAVCR